MRNFSHQKKAITRFLVTHTGIRLGLLCIILVSLSLFMVPDMPSLQYHLDVGDVAPRNIKAPRNFIIENSEATETSRQLAAASVRVVYDLDEGLGPKVIANVQAGFHEMRQLLEEPVPLPSGETAPLSMDALRSQKVWTAKPRFENLLGIPVSEGAFRLLEREAFSQNIEDKITEILRAIYENGVVANKTVLLDEQDRGVTLRTLESDKETTETNLRRFYGPDQARTMVRIVGEPLLRGMHYNQINLIVDLSQRLIRPNITLNRSETQKRTREATSTVKPVLYQIKAGEMLLREGERVTPVHKIKLDALASQIRTQDIFRSNAGNVFLSLLILLTAYCLCFRRPLSQSRNPNKNMFLLTTVLLSVLAMAKGFQVLTLPMVSEAASFTSPTPLLIVLPVAGAAMLICLFFTMTQALPFALVMGSLTAIVLKADLALALFFILSGAMGAYWMQDCKERKVFVKAGWKLGLFHIFLALALLLQMENISLSLFFWMLILAFTGGMLSGILTAGLVPLLEIIFDYTTDIKLLELANPEQPLLRRLMLEAPGTYNHAMIVGTLAEAAASEIGAHSLLARVGGYYHDIGKLSKPLYFIENQGGGKNSHDKLAPSMSALILITHVRDGVSMARQHKLGEAITDIIAQHHGRSLIRFFYEKANMLKGEADPVNADDYRYPGPRPQTREAAIVMMADVVEAASRTLENPTSARIQGLVQKMINSIFSDSQLDECDITLKDLHRIARSFNKILTGIYHHRIEYAESAAPGGTKKKNVHTDRQLPESDAPQGKGSDPKSDAHLKRLGMS
ncbi:HDIG domain-containing protein [Desulfobotulus sp. H1]|uniref:HDIG domain-containing protein n=1 Tax=Desulfobotulus pelophilus TaxID=2823377 RepID=A0ABT3N4V0_9BACT|nr:HDIG domain-containing metalloprotein [Desulfobotulus pelophilus]MCW7752485.1 HDIG domain-containing protein [Desulfobotulus pelophilus]